MEIVYRPIGIIHTPFKEQAPIQPLYSDARGVVEVFDAYADGLKDLETFSHIILLYHFHLSKGYRLQARPYLDEKPRGIFAIRSPNRPNGIGLSIVALEKIENTALHVRHVDMLDGTPLLDIKPYIPEFDIRDADSGWLRGKIHLREKREERSSLYRAGNGE